MTIEEPFLSVAAALLEMDGHVCGPAPAFLTTFFPQVKTPTEEAISEAQSSPDEFVPWFTRFCAENPSDSKWEMKHYFNSDGEGVDLSLTSPAQHIKTIGNRCTDGISYREGLARLYSHARNVFNKDPTRLFLHAFYVHGETTEYWVFDRSGMYSSEASSLRGRFSRFAHILRLYQDFNDQETGQSPSVQLDNDGSHLANSRELRRSLEPQSPFGPVFRDVMKPTDTIKDDVNGENYTVLSENPHDAKQVVTVTKGLTGGSLSNQHSEGTIASTVSVRPKNCGPKRKLCLHTVDSGKLGLARYSLMD